MMLIKFLAFYIPAIHASTNSVAGSSNSLTFLIIGDWGKGGTTGNIWSRRMEDAQIYSNSSANLTISDAEEDIQIVSVFGGGSTNQLAVATSMGSYANTTETKPSFVVSLGDNFYTVGFVLLSN